jgi:hypothetical protein
MNESNEKGANSSWRNLAVQIIYFVMSIITALLLLRFALVLLSANESNGFVDFIYSLSEPLVSPFYGVFNNDFAYGQGKSRFDFETLFALVIYAVIAGIAVKAVSLGKRSVQA